MYIRHHHHAMPCYGSAAGSGSGARYSGRWCTQVVVGTWWYMVVGTCTYTHVHIEVGQDRSGSVRSVRFGFDLSRVLDGMARIDQKCHIRGPRSDLSSLVKAVSNESSNGRVLRVRLSRMCPRRCPRCHSWSQQCQTMV